MHTKRNPGCCTGALSFVRSLKNIVTHTEIVQVSVTSSRDGDNDQVFIQR